MEPILGFVTVDEQTMAADGHYYWAFVGKISVLQGSSLVGFDIVTERNANWVAMIQGPTQTYYIPGCKVQMIGTLDGNQLSHDKMYHVL